MTSNATNCFDELRCAAAPPASIGRGSGMTIKEFKQRLNQLMRRKQMPNRQWRSRSQRAAEAVDAPGCTTWNWAGWWG